MKKITFIMALVLAMTMGAASQSFAGIITACPNGSYFCAFNIVDNTGATAWTGPTDSYGDPALSLAQTPVLYFQLSDASDKIDGLWIKEEDASKWEAFGSVGPTSGTDGWMSPAMWSGLNDSDKLGHWSVLGHIQGTSSWTIDSAGNLDCPSCAIANFVVTPEPVSMALYGIGGLPLAARFLRRRKVTA